MAPTSAARHYARFVRALTLDAVPAPVAARARVLALDIVGSCLASSREDFGRAAIETAARLGGGRAGRRHARVTWGRG